MVPWHDNSLNWLSWKLQLFIKWSKWHPKHPLDLFKLDIVLVSLMSGIKLFLKLSENLPIIAFMITNRMMGFEKLEKNYGNLSIIVHSGGHM